MRGKRDDYVDYCCAHACLRSAMSGLSFFPFFSSSSSSDRRRARIRGLNAWLADRSPTENVLSRSCLKSLSDTSSP